MTARAARRVTRLLAALILVAASALPAAAQSTHLLVIVGVGGSDEHTKRFHGYGSSIVAASIEGGLAKEQITYLADRPELDPLAAGRSNRENVTKAFTELAAKAGPDDEIFVVLIGHGSFDGKVGAFNLAGPDLSAADYAGLLNRFKTQHIVFVNTASSSGAFQSALAGPGRTIVTATRTGGERNEPRFTEHFVAAWTDEAADSDRNGRVSVFEAFEYARLRVEASYSQTGHIPTEHPTLDDGSEGKVAAMQYLTPPRSRAAGLADADPKLRALLERQEELQRRVENHRLQRDRMEQDAYEAELEKLLTELAIVSRQIRELEGAR